MENIEKPIKYYLEKDNGYLLKFCHLETELNQKPVNTLIDRWFFAKTYKMQEYFQNDEPENENCFNSL